MKIFVLLSLFLSIHAISGESETKLNQAGVKLDKGSRMILNQQMKGKKKKGEYYFIEFACKHKDKFDTCIVSKVSK